MSKVLVVSKATGQTRSFERVMLDYTEKNNLPLTWVFATEADYEEIVSAGDVTVSIISPEIMLIQEKVKGFLDSKSVPHITLKPVDFALKNTAKIMPLLEPFIK